MVVLGPTNILVGEAGTARLDVERRSAIESVLENGSNVAIRTCTDLERTRARGFDALRAILACEPEDAETRAVAVLRMTALGEQALGKQARADAHGRGPTEDALWRPLGVRAMRGRHVLGHGGVSSGASALAKSGPPPLAKDGPG